MINIIKKYTILTSIAATLVIGLVGCNKEFSDVAAVNTSFVPFNSALSLDSIVRVNPNFTFLKRAIERIPNLRAALADPNRTYTVFAPTDAAFATIGVGAISGLSNIVVSPTLTIYRSIDSIPLANLGGILQYHLAAGKVTTANVTGVPNTKVATAINLAPLAPPSSPVPVNMNMFISKIGANFFANTVPIVTADIASSNGIIHVLGGVLIPPQQTVKAYFNAEADLTMLRAAIARADSGAAPGTSFDAIASNGLVNITLLAPTNTAFAPLIYGLVYPNIYSQTYATIYPTVLAAVTTGNPTFSAMQLADSAARRTAPLAATSAAATATTASTNPATFNALPVASVKGIVAYHLIGGPQPLALQTGTRYFGINFAGLTSVNSIIAIAPLPSTAGLPIGVDNSGTLPKFLGRGNGPGNFSNIVTANANCVNGVVHKIDRVLLPQ